MKWWDQMPWSSFFWMLHFKPAFSLSSFTFFNRLFSYSSFFAIRVVSSAYLRLLIFLMAIFKVFLLNFFIFYWRIIALQNFVVFCQTSIWISHRYTHIPSFWNLPPLCRQILYQLSHKGSSIRDEDAEKYIQEVHVKTEAKTGVIQLQAKEC